MAEFIYRPTKHDGPKAINSTIGVKFADKRHILDEWWIIGGTRWSRFRFRLKHPIVYSKRGLLRLYRRIKRIFVKPKMIQPIIRHPHDL